MVKIHNSPSPAPMGPAKSSPREGSLVNPVAQEFWFAQRIAHLARRAPREAVALVWAADTTAAERIERLRRMILDWGVASQPMGRHNGEVVTVRQHFERVYGQPLEATSNIQHVAARAGR
ncbi:MAG: hypothetical protein ACP5P4_15110 [Steroidobacteraceae bacterium]